MKKNYFFFLITFVCMHSYAQSNCADAQPDIGYAYSHAKTAYEANNLTHLKQYAGRSLEAFKRVESILKSCNCPQAYNNAFDAIESLEKIAEIDTYENGRFFIKRAREFAKETIGELEFCTKWSQEDHELAELANEKLKLEEQRKALRLKEDRISQKINAQKEREILLKKEKIITENELALQNSINAFNRVLQTCGCDSAMTKNVTVTSNLKSESIEFIKTYYLNTIKQLTNDYLGTLNECSIK